MADRPYLDVTGLNRHFDISDPFLARVASGGRKRILTAVDDVSFSIAKGQTYALVGESGSGKSTIARMIVGLERPDSGRILIDGQTAFDQAGGQAQDDHLRQKLQMVFQSPYSSLNPRWRVGDILMEPIKAFGLISERGAQRRRVDELLEQVGLSSPDAARFPHEFSGGQRQRIGIARALILEPEFVVCDEPISALDVSVQAQVINLLGELKETMGLTLLFIAHDLSMVRYVSDRMAVMYLGSLVELGKADEVYFNPKHPYTEVLIGSNPEPDPNLEKGRASTSIQGEIPSPVNVPSGCRFANRCPKVLDVCREKTPELIPVKDEDRLVACHLVS